MYLQHLDKLNSLTKYPSIPTYHALGERGVFKSAFDRVDYKGGPVVLTEKVDGTNVRIIMTDHAYMIGSREEFLYYSEDLLHNPALGIVENVIDIAIQLQNSYRANKDREFTVIYGELYGGNIGSNAKQYTNSKSYEFRVFDVWSMYNSEVSRTIDDNDKQSIAKWRDDGGQPFYNIEDLQCFCDTLGLNTVPVLDVVESLPIAFEEVKNLLDYYLPETKVSIDGGIGKSEGIVARTRDRKVISKLRFQDYERTLKQLKK